MSCEENNHSIWFTDTYFPIVFPSPSISNWEMTLMSTFSVTEDKENGRLVLEMELPGVKKEDLLVKVRDDYTLVIFGKRKEKKFEHSYGVPSRFDLNTVDAKLEDGILTITIKENQTCRKIDVR